MGGSDLILKPEIDLVMQGRPPVRAPLFLVWPSSASFYLKLLMIVDLPTLGTPAIMSHDPTVLNWGEALASMKLSNLLMFTFYLVER